MKLGKYHPSLGKCKLIVDRHNELFNQISNATSDKQKEKLLGQLHYTNYAVALSVVNP